MLSAACLLKTSGVGISFSATVACNPPSCRFGNGALPTPLKTGRPWFDVVIGYHPACLSGQNVTSSEPAISRSRGGDVRGSYSGMNWQFLVLWEMNEDRGLPKRCLVVSGAARRFWCGRQTVKRRVYIDILDCQPMLGTAKEA